MINRRRRAGLRAKSGLEPINNQNNRLIRVSEGEVLGGYVYNGKGERVVKEVDGATTYYIYDFDGHLIAEADGNGNTTIEYLRKGSTLIAKADYGESNVTYSFYLVDRLGTPLMMVDKATNTLVWEAIYKPFGEAEVNGNSSVSNNLRFPGQYYDQETGLHYNYHRYYDPTTGRYLTPDPLNLGTVQLARQNYQTVLDATLLYQYGLTNPQVLNLYLYAQANPISFIDPLGLINLAEAYAKVERSLKPYVVGGALVVTGAVTTAAGAITAGAGFVSIPETGPAGAFVMAIGASVTVTGAGQITLGLDVYADELRRQLGLPEWFDVLRDFQLLPHEEGECE